MTRGMKVANLQINVGKSFVAHKQDASSDSHNMVGVRFLPEFYKKPITLRKVAKPAATPEPEAKPEPLPPKLCRYWNSTLSAQATSRVAEAASQAAKHLISPRSASARHAHPAVLQNLLLKGERTQRHKCHC